MSILTFWPMTSADGVAEEALGCRIHGLDLPIHVNGENGVHGRVEDGAGAGLAVFQFADGGLEVGDVAGDAGEHAPVAQVQLADGEVHGEGRAVLAQADHLAADADDLLLAGRPVVLQVVVMLVPVGLGHEHLDVAALDFAGQVAEELLGRRVHRLDHAAFVDGDDCVHGRVEDGPRAGLAFKEGLL